MSTNKKGITFIGAISMMLTLVLFHDFFMDNISTRHIAMCFVYIMIGLATDNHKGISELIQRIWSINQNGDSPQENFDLIKSFIKINVNKWDTYWHLYEEVVDKKKKKSALKSYLLRIPRGTLSLMQFLWIIGYIIYGIFSGGIYTIGIAEPVNFLIDLIGLSFFIYTGSKVIGIGDFMTNIFEAIKEDEGKIKQSLQLLEAEIIFGARHYGFLKGKLDLSKGDI